MQRQAHAFTLVELLVVVTIIVILLSLLMPAMNKAIYHSRLAQCAGNMRSTAAGVQQYAMNFRKSYPNRQLPAPGGKPISLYMLAAPDDPAGTLGGLDIRPQLDGYLQINKHLNEPFTEQLDLENKQLRDSVISATYPMWFGWSYRPNTANLPGYPGMDKIGDHWEFGPGGMSAYGPPIGTGPYGILMSDGDLFWSGRSNIAASHPDVGSQPKLILQTAVDQFIPDYGANGMQTFWIGRSSGGSAQRQSLDLNFTYDDGAVIRMSNLEAEDDRYAVVPYAHDSHLWQSFRVHIPKR